MMIHEATAQDHPNMCRRHQPVEGLIHLLIPPLSIFSKGDSAPRAQLPLQTAHTARREDINPKEWKEGDEDWEDGLTLMSTRLSF